MKKTVIALLICLCACAIVIAFQARKITQTEQNLSDIFNFISSADEEILTPSIHIDELSGQDSEIIDDLLKHKELIPFEGVLGGTPFYSNKVTIHKSDENKGYVVIDAEDGHIGARLLLFFEKSEIDLYQWKLIAYNEYGEEWILP